jgi:hypothetical protein
LLRLLEQPLGLHRRFDRIEHDADRGRELFENIVCNVVNSWIDASSITALT